jgi:hypothetical protein
MPPQLRGIGLRIDFPAGQRTCFAQCPALASSLSLPVNTDRARSTWTPLFMPSQLRGIGRGIDFFLQGKEHVSSSAPSLPINTGRARCHAHSVYSCRIPRTPHPTPMATEQKRADMRAEGVAHVPTKARQAGTTGHQHSIHSMRTSHILFIHCNRY